MKKLIIIVITTLSVLATSYFLWNNYKNSAEYALKQIETAIIEKNGLKFERYVDVDAFCEQTIDASLQQVITEQFGSSKSGFEMLGGAIGLSIVDKLKPTLISLFRSALIESIESGDFASFYEKTDPSNEISLRIIENIFEVYPDSLVNVGELNVDGDIGIFNMNFYNVIFDTTLTIRLKMERVNKNWKVSGFYNIEKYMADLKKMKDSKLSKINLEIRQRIDSIVQFDEIYMRYYTKGYSDYIQLSLRVKNISKSDTISILKVSPQDKSTKKSDDDVYFWMSDIEPGKYKTDKTKLIYNQFVDFHKSLRIGWVEPKIETLFVSNENGPEIIGEFKTWEDYKKNYVPIF